MLDLDPAPSAGSSARPAQRAAPAMAATAAGAPDLGPVGATVDAQSRNVTGPPAYNRAPYPSTRAVPRRGPTSAPLDAPPVGPSPGCEVRPRWPRAAGSPDRWPSPPSGGNAPGVCWRSLRCARPLWRRATRQTTRRVATGGWAGHRDRRLQSPGVARRLPPARARRGLGPSPPPRPAATPANTRPSRATAPRLPGQMVPCVSRQEPAREVPGH